MATSLKNIVHFVDVLPGVPTVLPHGLNIDDRAVPPDLVIGADNDFDVTADAVNVTVTSALNTPASIDVYVEHWHSTERAFGAAPADIDGELVPQPFVVLGGSGSADEATQWNYVFRPFDPAGPRANVYTDWNDLYAVLRATTDFGVRQLEWDCQFCPLGPLGRPTFTIPANTNGVGDSIGGAAPNMTLTDAAGLFTSDMVGQSIIIAGATTPNNNGSFLITGFVSPTQIAYTNTVGVAEAFPGTWALPWDMLHVWWVNDLSDGPFGGFDQIAFADFCYIDKLSFLVGSRMSLVHNGTLHSPLQLPWREAGASGINVDGPRLNFLNTEPTARPMIFAYANGGGIFGKGANHFGPLLSAFSFLGGGLPASPAPVVDINGKTFLLGNVDFADNSLGDFSAGGTGILSVINLQTVNASGRNGSLLWRFPNLPPTVAVSNIMQARFRYNVRQTLVTTTRFDAIYSDALFVDTIGGLKTIQLPTAYRTRGENMAIKDATNNALANPITIRAASGATGVGDTIGGVAPNMTLTDAAALFQPSMLGRRITIAGAVTPANNGVFVIIEVASPTVITYTNPAGVAEVFPGTWAVDAGAGDSIGGAAPNMVLTDAAGLFDASMVGRVVTIAGAGIPANDGTFPITAATTTTLTYTNAAGAAEAVFPGTWLISETIDGAPTFTISTNLGAVELTNDGFNHWFVISNM